MSLLSALLPLLAVYRAGIAAILRQLGRRRRCPPPAARSRVDLAAGAAAAAVSPPSPSGAAATLGALGPPCPAGLLPAAPRPRGVAGAGPQPEGPAAASLQRGLPGPAPECNVLLVQAATVAVGLADGILSPGSPGELLLLARSSFKAALPAGTGSILLSLHLVPYRFWSLIAPPPPQSFSGLPCCPPQPPQACLTPEEGASTSIYAAVSPEMEGADETETIRKDNSFVLSSEEKREKDFCDYDSSLSCLVYVRYCEFFCNVNVWGLRFFDEDCDSVEDYKAQSLRILTTKRGGGAEARRHTAPRTT
ncbi:hypothetical protein LUU34_00903700 [Aix galericulata]|nr:hypothetical protein LUU34_00903700 [Aix galericulata]